MRSLTKAAACIAAGVALILCSVPCYADSGDTVSIDKAYELVTSYNPNAYCNIKIDGDTISLEGKYTENEHIRSVYIHTEEDAYAKLDIKDDGSFSGTIDTKDVPNGRYQIFFVLNDGTILNYAITYDGEWFFPDNGIKEHNAETLEHIIQTGSEAWASYVSDDLDPDSVQQTINDIKALSDEINSGIESDYDKMLATGKWVSDNIAYDHDARDESVTLSTICLKNVLERKRTVCSGYTNLFCALLEAQGIETVNLKAATVDSPIFYKDLINAGQNHEFAAVKIDGRWAFYDVVWNSQNDYRDGKFYYGSSREMYSDPSPLALSFNHRADRAESRSYLRAMEYFDNVEVSREDFSYDPLPLHPNSSSDPIFGSLYVSLIIAGVIALLAAMVIIIIKRRGKTR